MPASCSTSLQRGRRKHGGTARFRTFPPTSASASRKRSITREENKVVAAIKKLRSSGEAVPSNSPDKRRHGTSHPISEHAEGRYRAIRRRKLAGEHIPDGEWQWFIDYARRLKDPQYELLRGSPAAFGFSLTV